MIWEPSYLELHRGGELRHRAERLSSMLSSCTACPRRCQVDRGASVGECGTPVQARVASWGPHFGEEPPLTGSRGSGTVFLSSCNLRCRFCQNADISQPAGAGTGEELTAGELAAVMLELQARGCHNINWVSPTHQVAALVEALDIAAERGLDVPVVYNSNAYESPTVLRLLDGVVDVYLPDLKYADADVALRLSGVEDYAAHARAAITEMFRQVGSAWETDAQGVLRRGLLVRLLVLPGGLAGEEDSLRWLAAELSPEVAVSLMSQYRPTHRAADPDLPEALARRLSAREYRRALEVLREVNCSENSYVQPGPV